MTKFQNWEIKIWFKGKKNKLNEGNKLRIMRSWLVKDGVGD